LPPPHAPCLAAQEIASKLDHMYKLSEEENRRLRTQFKCQEDDREYLIRQVRCCCELALRCST